MSEVSGTKSELQPPPLVSPVSSSLQDATKPLKETLDKINMLEQNTVSLDKQSAGIQRMVTEVVKKQEENTSVRYKLSPLLPIISNIIWLSSDSPPYIRVPKLHSSSA